MANLRLASYMSADRMHQLIFQNVKQSDNPTLVERFVGNGDIIRHPVNATKSQKKRKAELLLL
jgi:hypothetical protein